MVCILIEDIVIKPDQAKLRAQLYQLGAVLKESVDENGDWLIKIRITADQKRRLLS